MKKRTTVYEDRARKEEKRRQYEEEYRKKHTVQCPYCQKDMLDSMKQCPNCKREVKPTGYQPMSKKKIAIIRGCLFVVGMIAAILVLYFTTGK